MWFKAVWSEEANTYLWERSSMNKEEYFKHQAMTHERCLEISRAKCGDYANDDPFSNFRLAEIMGICSVEQEILTYITAKMARICNLLVGNKERQVKDETVEDTLHDLINYAAILLAYLDSKKE
jgi:hypothetical protein